VFDGDDFPIKFMLFYDANPMAMSVSIVETPINRLNFGRANVSMLFIMLFSH
jgi:hypothetical protein